MTLALTLLLLAAPAECAVDDHACKTDRFTVLAAQSSDPAVRAQRLYAAHRSALSLHQKTGDLAALCRARALLDQSLAIDPRPEALVTPLEKAEADLRALESQHPPDCTPTRPTPRKKPARPAPPQEQPPSRPTVVELLDPTSPPALPPESVAPPPPPELLDSPQHTDPIKPPPSSPAPPRRSPARTTSGITLLLTSAGLAAGMAASLHERTNVLATFRDLESRTQGRDATPDEYAFAAAANRRYGRLTALAGFTGAAATTSILAGILLLATPPRRARLLALPWSAPRTAGLSLHARF